jgi:hypothetical protein
MSDGNGVPPVGPLGYRLGLELGELAFRGVTDPLEKVRTARALKDMLAADPLSVLDFIPLPAAGTHGLRVAVRIRDDFGVNLARAAHKLELWT